MITASDEQRHVDVAEAATETAHECLAEAPRPVDRESAPDPHLRRMATNLAEARDADDTRAEAFEAIRGLVDEVRLVPHENDLKIELYGELAALLILGNENPRSTEAGVQLTMVAGA